MPRLSTNTIGIIFMIRVAVGLPLSMTKGFTNEIFDIPITGLMTGI
jgi:hypothetical protein